MQKKQFRLIMHCRQCLLYKYKNTPENLLKIENINIAEDLAIKNKEIEIALALI